jgi:hypothetical protein
MATVPLGKDVVVMVTKPSMVMLNGAEVPVAGGLSASATWMVKVEGPRVVGVPEIVAVLSGLVVSVSPGGREPLATLQLYGRTPPVAIRVAL